MYYSNNVKGTASFRPDPLWLFLANRQQGSNWLSKATRTKHLARLQTTHVAFSEFTMVQSLYFVIKKCASTMMAGRNVIIQWV